MASAGLHKRLPSRQTILLVPPCCSMMVIAEEAARNPDPAGVLLLHDL